MFKTIKKYFKYKSIGIKNSYRINKSKSKINHLHNLYSGKRCFIIGNGPSLRVEDLEKLKDEICFGSNRIYNIFDKTDWRPTYYCVQDIKLIEKSTDEINKIRGINKIIGIVKYIPYKKLTNAYFINLHCKEFYPDLPEFSVDVANAGIYEGYTVSYMCLQLAIYMGFKEIYLLGIDHSYSVDTNPDGTIRKKSGLKDHFSEKDKIDNIPQTYKSTLAYESAEKYAKNNGIKIYNATRGGKLEVFERLDFDKVINNLL